MKPLLEQFGDNNFLVTTDNWFFAPDGKQYRAVWGKVSIHSDTDVTGLKTNVRSSNWYAKIGIGENAVIVAGCQIHYACVCLNKPETGIIKEQRWVESRGELVEYETKSVIYLAQ